VSVGTWVVLDSISGTQGTQWIEIVEDLSAYANKTVKIKFTAHGELAWYHKETNDMLLNVTLQVIGPILLTSRIDPL